LYVAVKADLSHLSICTLIIFTLTRDAGIRQIHRKICKIYVRRDLQDVSKANIPVLKINDHATGGRRTKDILGGPKGWGPKKKVANVEIYVIFEVFAFCGGRTKTDFKDRACVCCICRQGNGT